MKTALEILNKIEETGNCDGILCLAKYGEAQEVDCPMYAIYKDCGCTNEELKHRARLAKTVLQDSN